MKNKTIAVIAGIFVILAMTISFPSESSDMGRVSKKPGEPVMPHPQPNKP